jgi:hypothetical protein
MQMNLLYCLLFGLLIECQMSFSIYHNMFSISFYLFYFFFEDGYFLVFLESDMMNFISHM